ncbi:MAG TPA: helix-turn-helix domain-containing protein [Polyangiales bacterium]|nr:helix-turn-helix domain-containing protein [Polyangiales bacterium]
MEWREASTENCPVGRALELLGERWTLLIVRDALNGVRRFDDFRRHIGLSEAVLADRLRKLVEAGVLDPHAYQDSGQRERYEYRLTPKGRELLPVVIAIKQWGETHYADPKGPVIEVRHKKCDGEVRVVLACSEHGSRALTVYDTYARPGPGARRAKQPLPKRDD